MSTSTRIRSASIAALLAALAACASTPTEDTTGLGPDGQPWLQPSALLAAQMDEQIERLPWTHGLDRIEQIRWLASVGEPAYSRLLVLCSDERADVAASAVAALGATQDSRLVEPLRRVKWKAGGDRALELERARAYLRLGDWSRVNELVDGLADDSLWARAWCSQALFESTKERLGYDPRATLEERGPAVERWRQWLAERRAEGILVTDRR